MTKKTGMEKTLDEIMADLANFLAVCDIYKEGNREFTC
jgi:hypothetical protein